MPSLYDAAEFAIVRKTYFEPATTKNNDIDPLERLDRMNARRSTNHAR